MRIKNNKILSLIMASLLAASAASGCSGTDKDKNNNSNNNTNNTPTKIDYKLADNIEDGAILHAWSWSFKTITESLEDIAAAGYTTIQTSPINACYVGGNGGMQLYGEGKWYYHYQPIDWTIGNYQLGTKDEFTEMCTKAHEYGIKIIVDVVPNHTVGNKDEVSENLINAVGGIDNLYHPNGTKNISSYSDRLQCTSYAMNSLYDVNTENPKFQDYFISYLNECIACGADGFRYDTAKHIALSDDPKADSSLENNFWERVTTEITNADKIFNYGEILQGDNERISDYISAIGHATASSYGYIIREGIKGKNLTASKMEDFSAGGSDSVVTWVESHDNYTGDGTNQSLSDKDIILGWAIICARAEGTPLFFDRPYGSTSNNMWGTINRIGAAGSDLYKNPTVVAVNRFRNAMVGENESFSNPNNNKSVLMIERGTKGCVIINSSTTSVSLSDVKVSLANGSYTNRVDNTSSYTVTNGTLSGTIPAQSVIVLYNDGYNELTKSAAVSADFETNVFYTDTYDFIIHCKDSSSATYSINGGTETSYTDGTKITIGNGSAANDTITVTLKAKNSAGATTTMTYYFTKKVSVADGAKIYFKKPSNWSNTVNAYIYDESGSTTLTVANWPGVAMKDEGNGLYSYEFTEGWSSALVIFNDGSNQLPAAMEPGYQLQDGMTYGE